MALPPLSGAKPHTLLHAEPGNRRIQPALSALPAARRMAALPPPMQPTPFGTRPPVLAQTPALPSSTTLLQQQYAHHLLAAPPRYGVFPSTTQLEVAYAHGLFAMTANRVSAVPAAQSQPSVVETHLDDYSECVWPGCAFASSKTRLRAHVASVHEAKPVTERGLQATVQGNQPPADTTRGARIRDLDIELTAPIAAPAPVQKPVIKGKVWYCVACNEEFAFGAESRTHMRTHESCLAPGCQFSASRVAVLQHFVDDHGSQSQGKSSHASRNQPSESDGKKPKSWRCEPCNKDLEFKDQLREHKRQHMSCPERFCKFAASGSVMKPHVADKHGPTVGSTSRAKPLASAATYCCKICGIPGHLIYDCPQHVKGYTAKEKKKKKKGSKPWRCEPCDKHLTLESQLQAHIAQHESCSKPDCAFSAAKRVVTQHLATAHGSSNVKAQ